MIPVARALLVSVLISFVSALVSTPALALNRVEWWYSLNPPSPWMNTATRYQRLGFGQWILDSFGQSTVGRYANLVVTPAGALTVQVGPSGSNQQGALYQYAADDANTFGGGTYGSATALAADPTQIFVQGTTTQQLPGITVSAGTTTGQSIDNLIECQVQTADANSQSVNFISSLGVVTPGTANRDRNDTIVCQNKASASASSPTVPTVDTNWVAIGYAQVPYGTATVTSGMITPLGTQQFNGFALATAPGATAIDTSSTAQAKAGALSTTSLTATGLTSGNCVQVGTGGLLQTASGPCGLGSGTITSVNAGTNTTVTGTASAPVVNVASAPTFSGSVTGSAGFSATSGGYVAGSSTYGPSGATVAGNIAATNGVFAAGSGYSAQLCPNNNCGVSTYIDTSGNLHVQGAAAISGVATASQFNGSGAGLTAGTVPLGALTTTPATGNGVRLYSTSCSASSSAVSSWYCTASLAGAGFTSSYSCATGFNTGSMGAAGGAAAGAWYARSLTQVDLYQNQTSGGVVTALCWGT